MKISQFGFVFRGVLFFLSRRGRSMKENWDFGFPLRAVTLPPRFQTGGERDMELNCGTLCETPHNDVWCLSLLYSDTECQNVRYFSGAILQKLGHSEKIWIKTCTKPGTCGTIGAEPSTHIHQGG